MEKFNIMHYQQTNTLLFLTKEYVTALCIIENLYSKVK